MTDKATLLALAERVEALTGPDASTNADILRAFGWTSGNGGIAVRPDGSLSSWVPDYLGSLDATMTLVPEGLRWCTDDIRDGRPRAFVEDLNDFSEGAESHNGIAATPALALTAAALRAHASLIDSQTETM